MILHLVADHPSFRSVAEAAARDIVRMREVDGGFYISLPLLYPDGSYVTVRLTKSADGALVSDAGFAYREAEDVGAHRSFRRVANKLANEYDVEVGGRSIEARASINQIERAIIDVATASWRVATAINDRASEEDELQLSDQLASRLRAVFGEEKVAEGASLTGFSTNEWPVSAVVTIDGHRTVFQAVSAQSNSVYRASTAFRDISAAGRDISLVSFVRSKAALGPKLSLLTPSRVIEEAQPDDILRRAAA